MYYIKTKSSFSHLAKMIVFRFFFSQNLKNTVHTKIPYTPTLYRTVPYTKNPVPHIVYGTVHRGHPAEPHQLNKIL